MAEVTSQQVKQVADLAHLEFAPDELQAFFREFRDILGHFAQLAEIDTADVPPLYHALESDSPDTPWRADEVVDSLPRSAALEAAPATDGEHFQVPKVIE